MSAAAPTPEPDRDGFLDPEITRQIRRSLDGDAGAREEVFTWLVGEIDRVARAKMRRQPAGHTLQATALVNEAVIKLLRAFDRHDWKDRNHLRAVAIRAMNQVLIDHARRGGDAAWTLRTFGEIGGKSELSPAELLDLHEVLLELEESRPRQAEVIRLRFFAGMSMREVAAELGLSQRRVEQDWAVGRSRLLRLLRRGQSGDTNRG